MLFKNILQFKTDPTPGQGLQQAVTFGVYSPSIGFTLQFGNSSKGLVPISGILICIGGIVGGFWQTFHGNHLSKLRWGRRLVILSGVFLQFISYILIFINLPASASHGNTEDKAIIESNVYIALLCGFLLGMGDGCLNTQNYSIIAILYPNQSAHSCALYKFIKAVFVSAGCFMSSYLSLHQLLGLLSVTAIFGLITFIIVDKTAIKIQSNNTNKDLEMK